jgi:diguanylate cyclase (GGDEF)-like protein
VLAEVARQLGHQGVAGRLGGDEFAVWVPSTSADSHDAAQAILRDVADAFDDHATGLDVGVSIGTAHVSGKEDSLPSVLSAADAALYDAKRAGRGRVASS